MTWRGDPLLSCPNDAIDTRLLQKALGPSFRSSCKCFHQVRNAFIRAFPPEERRSSSPTRPETMHGLTEERSVRPAVRPGEGNSPTIKPYREYVPFPSPGLTAGRTDRLVQPCIVSDFFVGERLSSGEELE